MKEFLIGVIALVVIILFFIWLDKKCKDWGL